MANIEVVRSLVATNFSCRVHTSPLLGISIDIYGHGGSGNRLAGGEDARSLASNQQCCRVGGSNGQRLEGIAKGARRDADATRERRGSGGYRLTGRIGKCKCALGFQRRKFIYSWAIVGLLGRRISPTILLCRISMEPHGAKIAPAPIQIRGPAPTPSWGDFVPRPRFNRVGSPR
jgi:hypothetical protein